MRHRQAKITLDRTASQRRSLQRNLAVSLITHGRIMTTDAKAKATRAFVERLVTIGKQGNLSGRRQLLSKLNNPAAVEKLLTTISPRFKDRPGGYLRCLKVGLRPGDGARRVRLEFIAT
ncbi:MAG: 50S ribosomal protein L17 [Patescibacteria group bacterium]